MRDHDAALVAHVVALIAVGTRERWHIERRELYVGMTRARDGLWVGTV